MAARARGAHALPEGYHRAMAATPMPDVRSRSRHAAPHGRHARLSRRQGAARCAGGLRRLPRPGAKNTPRVLLAHVVDLIDWARRCCEGDEDAYVISEPTTWEGQVARFYAALDGLDRAAQSPEPHPVPLERLFQAPIADALTHIGQLALLRRMAGAPVLGESYRKAEIVAGRLGRDQAPPGREFALGPGRASGGRRIRPAIDGRTPTPLPWRRARRRRRHLLHRQLRARHEVEHRPVVPGDDGGAAPVDVVGGHFGTERIGAALVSGDANLRRARPVTHLEGAAAGARVRRAATGTPPRRRNAPRTSADASADRAAGDRGRGPASRATRGRGCRPAAAARTSPATAASSQVAGARNRGSGSGGVARSSGAAAPPSRRRRAPTARS